MMLRNRFMMTASGMSLPMPPFSARTSLGTSDSSFMNSGLPVLTRARTRTGHHEGSFWEFDFVRIKKLK